jgi:AcrR family transcriptional regulator
MSSKRDKILDAAMHLFIEKGIHATATSLIAKEAGVATGTLFHHFKTKEELVHALYHAIYGSLLEFKQTHAIDTNDVYEKLKHQWRLDIEWGNMHVEYFHFLERYSFLYYASETAINEIFERFQEYLDIFKEAVAQSLMCSDDPLYIQEHFIWNIRMNMAFFIAHPDKCNDAAIDNAFEIYWKGIAK